MCCNYEISEDNIEEWLYHQLEDNTHVLHGVVHSNGYGHLLTLNGREGGSSVLCGFDIMNFWDRLCQTLSVRFGPLFFSFNLCSKEGNVTWKQSPPKKKNGKEKN